jgi:hypothetical protein
MSEPQRSNGPLGYPIKVQKVDRPTNCSYYLNLPMVLAKTLDVRKGEVWAWTVEDKNTLRLARVKRLPSRRLRTKP